ncbi:PH domain-containing protein [Candidatus Daviesbacteria bacterium]|nr:PH domain-containing protein [Candidatus Daviesbacteria bacterium]
MSKFHYKESPSLKQIKAFKPFLSEDEELVLVTGLSPAFLRSKFAIYFLFPGIIFGAIGFAIGWILNLNPGYSLLIALTLMSIIGGMKTMHENHANRYLFTTRRIIIKHGVFSTKLTAALYDKITHLEVDQTFVDRMLFHHGDVIVNTAGLNKGEIILKYVDYPMELKNLLERLINRERELYGRQTTTLTAVEGEVLDN